jgi:hypothetical protein
VIDAPHWGENFPQTIAQVIDFETKHPKHTPAKEALMRPTFGYGAARYYQRLNFILTTSVLLTQALEHNPTTTQRLLRQIEERAAARLTRKVTTP